MNGVKDPVSETAATFSFELFPPRDDIQSGPLRQTVSRLTGCKPAFFSMTYGAGGTGQNRSVNAVRLVKQTTNVPVAAHFTCVGAARSDIKDKIGAFLDLGIRRFVALRGDASGGVGTRYVSHPGGYRDTADLVADLKAYGAEDISVAAYPERHPDSPDWGHEMAVLKRKADAGASRAITQFFFDNDDYERFRDRALAAGITIPIVPGILPIHNFSKVRQFAGKCGAGIPDALSRQFANVDAGGKLHGLIAAAIVAEQVQDLKRRGVRQFHFYTMNQAELTEAVCRSVLSCAAAKKAAA